MSKLLPNLPVEDLTDENDYLGIIEKADLIKAFLESNTKEFERIKMFVLYGEWGSGKSTLMKYLEKELKGTFNTFFFEAWEFESDSNLSISLLEYLVDETKTKTERTGEDLLKTAENLLEGFTKSIRINAGLFSISGKELVAPMERKKESTFYESKGKFKRQFEKWEQKISGDNFNIVFIDDLDRCEPENVLNLLSVLKLFFTYGKRTIFFCGIDKKAVNQAVRTKYGDIIKAEEYLEKVFDITFRLQRSTLTYKLYCQYFSEDIKYSLLEKEENSLPEILNSFFNALNFNNPRKLKKVLNRYLQVKEFFRILKNSDTHTLAMPKIYEDDGICVFDLLFTLYFIIVQDFFPDIFVDIGNNHKRQIAYRKTMLGMSSEPNDGNFRRGLGAFLRILDKRGFNISFNTFSALKHRQGEGIWQTKIEELICNFTPTQLDQITSSSFRNADKFRSTFRVSQKGIDYYFSSYMLGTIPFLVQQEISSDASISYIVTLLKKIP